MKTRMLHLFITALFLLFTALLNTALYGQQAETAQATEQSIDQQEEKTFKLQGYILELIKKRSSEEQFRIILQEADSKDFSPATFADLLERLQIGEKKKAAFLQETNEYLELIDTVKKITPVALEVSKAETEIRNRKKAMEAAQSDEVRTVLADKIKELNVQAEKGRNRIKTLSQEINEVQTEYLTDILKQLGYGAEESKAVTLQITTQIDLIKRIDTINSMVEAIGSNLQEIERLDALKKQPSSDDAKQFYTKEIAMLSERIDDLYRDFTILVTGIDRYKLFPKEKEKTDWNRELQEVFSPLIVQLKQVTERPRQMEILRSRVGYYEARVPDIKAALQKIRMLKKNVTKKETTKQLLILEVSCKQYEKEYLSKLEAARSQLFELEKSKMSFPQVMDYLLQSVFKQRGTNMLYAAAAFILTFLLCYLFRLFIRKINPLNRSARFMFLGNLIDVLLYALSLFMATTVMAIVLYVYGNWLVLGMLVLILLGLIWTARNTLPKFVEQIKLLMGVGPVRQDERISVDGIPYQVMSIGIYSYFENPLLQSATLRFPLKDVVDMRSHPCDRSEPWFPCKEGDYVLMDGPQPVWRKVVLQTPNVMKLEWFGMVETVQTAAFLKRNILNLSEGPFWVRFELELGYEHRREVDAICQKLIEITSSELQDSPFADLLLAPWIDFDDFGDSSLVFRYWVQMRQEAAKSYPAVQRSLKKIALKAANRYDLEIIRFEHKCEHKFTESNPTTAEQRKVLPDSGQGF